MKGLQLSGYGDFHEMVTLVDVPDVGEPAAGEVVIAVEASPIDPTDLYIIAGVYGELPPLPHLLGCEGVGRVVAVGSEVRHLKVGDRTMLPPLSNAWVERVKTCASWLRPLPQGDAAQFSLLGINPPTAYILLTEFADLKAGDWVIQTAANSAVGRSAIPIARSGELKTINVVRRPEVVDELKALGGDVVLVDGPDLAARIAEATGGARIGLALDGVSGRTIQRLLDALPMYGTVVVWSGTSGQPAAIAGPHIVFTGQVVRGFWIVNWLKIPATGRGSGGSARSWHR